MQLAKGTSDIIAKYSWVCGIDEIPLVVRSKELDNEWLRSGDSVAWLFANSTAVHPLTETQATVSGVASADYRDWFFSIYVIFRDSRMSQKLKLCKKKFWIGYIVGQWGVQSIEVVANHVKENESCKWNEINLLFDWVKLNSRKKKLHKLTTTCSCLSSLLIVFSLSSSNSVHVYLSSDCPGAWH